MGTELEEGAGGLVSGGVTVGAGQVGDAGIAGVGGIAAETSRVECSGGVGAGRIAMGTGWV